MQTPQRLEEKNGSTETLIYNLSRRQHTKNIRIYMYTQWNWKSDIEIGACCLINLFLIWFPTICNAIKQ